MDARRIPYEDEFDVVGAFDVLEHVAEDEVALAAIHRAVRPGGGILLTVPQHPRLWAPADELAKHCRRYTRRELVDKVQRAGFEVTKVTSFVALLLPLMALSRARQRRSPNSYDELAEFRVSAFVQSVLGLVLSIELAMLRLGISFPAGGSLLLVGRKA
jgi:SAM-dependent methyltransferase